MGTRPFHEGGPEQTQFKGEDGPGHGADGEQDSGALRPALRQREVGLVLRLQPSPLRRSHQNRHRNAKSGKDDVEAQGHGHLSSCGDEV